MNSHRVLAGWLEEQEPDGGLTASQQRVAEVVSNNQQLASYSEIAEIADRARVNASTVVRFAKALGFRGWPDLQQELRSRYLAGLTTEETLHVHAPSKQSAVHDAITHDINNLHKTLEAIDAKDSDRIIEVLAGARRILVIATGSYTAPAIVLSHLGSVMGYPITFEGRGGSNLATALTTLGEGDVLVAINLWRTSRDVVTAAESARSAGVTVVTLTDMRKSALALASNHVLVIPSEGVSFFQSVTATTSVVYGIISGMAAAQPERSQQALRRTQEIWQQLGTFTD